MSGVVIECDACEGEGCDLCTGRGWYEFASVADARFDGDGVGREDEIREAAL